MTLTTSDPAQPSVSYNLICTGDTVVTSKTDNGQGDKPGTLSYLLLNRVGAGQTITFNLPSGGTTITVSSQLPPVPPGVRIEGTCGANGPLTVIKAASNIPAGSDGLILSSNVTLYGLDIRGFSGMPIRQTGSGNNLMCTNPAG